MVWILAAILLPLLGGLRLLLRPSVSDRDRVLWTAGTACAASAIVWIIILTIGRRGYHHTLLQFPSGFSIVFGTDGMACVFAGMLAVMWPLALMYAFSYMREDARKDRFFAFYLGTYGITLGVAFAGNLLTLYVFYEMLTLITIPLVAHYGNHESLYAARKYAAYTIGGASLVFLAMILVTIYGTRDGFVWGGTIRPGVSSRLLQIAYLLGFFGFGVKAAVFPLHDWLPEASVAPTPVTALLHAVAVVNSGVFAVTRLTWYVFGTEVLEGTSLQTGLLAVICFSMIFAAISALREKHLKRRLAYSTMSNLAYMLMGILMLNQTGFMAGMAHMIFHGVIKMSLFLCAGAFMHQTGRAYIYEVNGVGRRMPATFICFLLGALSLAGIPLFCGFISKWSLFTAAAERGGIPGIAGIVSLLAAAFLCAMYTLTVAVRAFFPVRGSSPYIQDEMSSSSLLRREQNPEAGIREVREADAGMLVPIIFFTVLNILFGLYPAPVLEMLQKISEGLW